MQMREVTELAARLNGVRRSTAGGLLRWTYHGRLIARELDDSHIVIRADFDYRDAMLRQFPTVFSVPSRFERHMMLVADLAVADAGTVEDALTAAWELQRAAVETRLEPRNGA